MRDRLLEGLGGISGTMDDTYNFNPGFHFAVVDDVIAHRVTPQAASNPRLVSGPTGAFEEERENARLGNQ